MFSMSIQMPRLKSPLLAVTSAGVSIISSYAMNRKLHEVRAGLTVNARLVDAHRTATLFVRGVMRVALIAPPFIPVPPICYGGTELFVAHLAEGLNRLGHDVVVYANGESTVATEIRWYYRQTMWPPTGNFSETLKEVTHTA